MPQIDFDALPADARLWIFPAGRALSAEEKRRVLAEADAFLAQWVAHGVPLSAARNMLYDQFVLVAVDENAAGVSGCSVDALVRRMQQLGRELGVELTDNAPVFYRDGDRVVSVSRDEFADLAASGKVALDTPVFNNTISVVGDLRAGKWETRAASSWHARAFF